MNDLSNASFWVDELAESYLSKNENTNQMCYVPCWYEGKI